MLTRSGAQVTIVGSAAEALATLQTGQQFTAALVDFGLPDIDGITLAKQIAKTYPTLILIGFSAHVIDETLRQRTSQVFRGIIQKPVPRDMLNQLIVKYISGGEYTLSDSGVQGEVINLQQLASDAELMGFQKIREWVSIFKQHSLPLLDQIDIARAESNAEQIKRLAHQLKSSCASLGMQNAVQSCVLLEQQPMADTQLKDDIQQGLRAIDQWLNKIH